MDLDPALWDESSSSGVICKLCGALVGRLERYPQVHAAWHLEHDDG